MLLLLATREHIQQCRHQWQQGRGVVLTTTLSLQSG